MPLGMDVREEGSVAAAYAEVNARFGRLDILVNCVDIAGKQGSLDALLLEDWEQAMLTNLTGTFLTCRGAIPLMRIHRWGRIVNLSSIYACGQAGRDQSAYVENMTLETWQTTLRVNLTGPFLMCRSAVPLMRRNRWGRIVNISLTSARGRPPVSNSNYSASKTALVGMTHVLANEVGADSITVNSVAPSRILTPMTLAAAHGDMNYFQKSANQTAVGRLAEPADIANAVAFLCDEASSFVTGAIINVNGGSIMA